MQHEPTTKRKSPFFLRACLRCISNHHHLHYYQEHIQQHEIKNWLRSDEMDFGSLIASVSLCILALPVVLLYLDLTRKKANSNNNNHADASTTDFGDKNRLIDPIDANETSNNANPSEPTVDAKCPIATTPTDDSHLSNWRCACDGGFLPPGLLQNFSGAEAVLRMSAGQCYHKKSV